MTQKLANAVKSLISDCYEAIKVIAGESKCGECKGTGKAEVFIENKDKNPALDGKCPQCIGTGKVKWEWKREPGDCFFSTRTKRFYWVQEGSQPPLQNQLDSGECIPILDWETIERILEEVGYRVKFEDVWKDNAHRFRCWIGIYEGGCTYKELAYSCIAKSRTIAMYKAVTALRKEIGNATKTG